MTGEERTTGSKALRLSPREWLVAGAIFVALSVAAPRVWQVVEPLEAGPDVRVPFALADDYWTAQRLCRRACAEDKILVVGDSVVWGHYVAGDQTLSHYLNALAGGPHYANLGLPGAHPAALAGLVETYGRALRGKSVILFCNLLWMTSPRRDLQGEDGEGAEDRFNHPRLVPQFSPSVPCYKESFEGRLGIAIQRELPLLNWAQHIRAACFENQDLAAWAKEHPYENPMRQVALELPPSARSPEEAPAAWTARRIAKFDPPWVDLDSSFQWDSFRRTIALLQSRRNRVFVLVGPFNEHMLEPESLARYRHLRSQVAAWLAERGIPHCIPDALPSKMYADASHPLSDGYSLAARRLYESQSFAPFRPTQQGPPER